MRTLSVLPLLVFVLLQAIAPPAAAGWVYQDIFVADSLQTRATDINNSGAIVGYYQPSSPPAPGTGNVGILIQGGVTSVIPISDPWGINSSGVVVGYSLIDGISHGQVFASGVLTQVDVPGAIRTELRGISDAGVIVGNYATPTSQNNSFTYFNGVFSPITLLGELVSAVHIDDAGNIYGYATATNSYVKISLDGSSSSLSYLYPGSTGTTVLWDGNSTGQIVGFGSGPGIVDRSYVYQNGTFTPLDHPGTPQTQAYGINDSGNVVGLWWDFSANKGHGFLATWDQSGGGTGSTVAEPPIVLLAGIAFALLRIQRRWFESPAAAMTSNSSTSG